MMSVKTMLETELAKLKLAHVIAKAEQGSEYVTTYIVDCHGNREFVEEVHHPFGNFALEGAMCELKNRVKALEDTISNLK